MNTFRRTPLNVLLSLAALPALTFAQDPAPAAGELLELSFTGSVQDLLIPTVDPPAVYRIDVKGGHGGNATTGKNKTCKTDGGRGAHLKADIFVGTDPLEVPPGSILRFIVGEAGESIDINKKFIQAFGGGGGGTGVLFLAPGATDWVPLLIAGGGGGSNQGATLWNTCGMSESGDYGALVSCGTDGDGGTNQPGGDGGCGGSSGETSDWGAGGGGGLDLGAGTSTGGAAGYPSGGAGGVAHHDESGDGGWGCGGGGAAHIAGGGGGGYSGGGGGGTAGEDSHGEGGGGGSLVSVFASPIAADHTSEGIADGWARIEGIPSADGETCETAFVIDDLMELSFTQVFLGDTTGALGAAPFSCFPVEPSHWFRFDNDTECLRVVTIGEALTPNAFVQVQENCGSSTGNCYLLAGSQVATLVVPPQGSLALRLSRDTSLVPFSEGPYELHVQVEFLDFDDDGDGVASCIDNCNSVYNPDQVDTDGDGYGDLCDSCPGADDGADDDGDGTPNGCDLCPGGDDSLDTDGDGVPDDCDLCIGDDTQDADGDGVPDACDPCFGPVVDCNQNGIGDACESLYLERFERFDAGLKVLYTLSGDAELDGGAAQLTDGSTGASGSVGFEPISPLELSSFVLEAYFVNDASYGPGGGNGMSLVIYDDALYDASTPIDHNGLGAGALSLLMDTHKNTADVNGNHFELRYDGTSLGEYDPSFTIEDGVWRKAVVEVQDGSVTVRIEEDGVVIDTPFVDVPLPGFAPFVARYGAGARSGAATARARVDQVLFRDLTGGMGPDEDGNGKPDSCQGAPHVIRTGFPPNPAALVLGAGQGPPLGGVYRPFVNHSTFMSSAQVDFLFVSAGPANLPLANYGTQLVAEPYLNTILAPAGAKFEVPIPVDGALLEVSLFMQAGSLNVLAPPSSAVKLTNAIDCQITGWQAQL